MAWLVKNKGNMALRKQKLQDKKEAYLQRKREKAEEAGSQKIKFHRNYETIVSSCYTMCFCV